MFCIPVTATGVELPIDRVHGWATLAPGTYYYLLNRPAVAGRAVCASQIQLGAGVVITQAALEDTCFGDPLWDESGSWVPETPSTGYVPCVGGCTASGSMVAGTGPGSALFNVAGLGSSRQRMRVIVTTGGLVRVSDWAEG